MLTNLNPQNESRRLQALRSYAVLDTPPEQALDNLTALAAHICEAPVALITLIDEDRQWFKSRVGLELTETPLDLSFCVYALAHSELFIVPDAMRDERFAQNPLVTGEPGVRFYAGAPLLTPEGEALGTLCVIDHVPRTLTGTQEEALGVLSQQVMTHLELRRQWRDLRASEGKLRAIFEAEPECVKLLGTDGTLHEINGTGLKMLEAERLENLPGPNLLPLVVAEDRKAVRTMLADVAAGSRRTVQYRIIGLKGTARWIEMSGAPFHDEATDTRLVLGVSLDITGRRLAEFWLDRVNRLHTVLSKTSEAILRGRDRVDLFDAVCRIAVEDGLLRMAMVVELDTETGMARVVASQGEGQEYLRELNVTTDGGPLSLGTIGTALRTGRPNFCNDFAGDPRMAPWRDRAVHHGFLATASFPLQRGGATVGALVLFANEAGYFRDDEIRLMAAVADNLSFGLEAQEGELLRRQAARELRASEQRFSRAFEYAAIGVALVAPDGRCLKVNRALCTMLGYAEAQLLTRTFQDLTHPEDLEADLGKVQSLLAGEIESYQMEKRYFHQSGEIVWALLSVSLVRDEAGQPVHFISQVQDITERKQAGERIAEQAALIDHAPDAITVRDLNHRITFWSKGAERLYGWTVEEAVGRQMSDLLHPDPEIFRKAFETVLRDGAWRGQFEKITKAGESLMLESRWTLLRNALDQPQSILAICTDITERKKLEQQFLRAQRMESIGTLAGGIAHDLNNSLAPIIMSLDLLAVKFTDPDSTELLEIVSSSARRGSDMVRQVLSFARGVEGERQEVQIRHLIREVEKIANDTFLKHITVRTSVPNDLWAVMGDATQLHQVLLNICVNARDSMPDGGVLTIKAHNVDLDAHYTGLSWNQEARPGPHVFLEVIDTGTGIGPKVKERIFDPFFTTKPPGKGTGLGLSTSLAIVKSHGGFIRVHSELGKGTTFEVYLPAQTGTAATALAGLPAEMPRGNGELILVVDDEMAVRQITDQTLKAFGYRVVLASDGAEAVSIFAREGKDIAAVLTDMMMPGMDGPATIQVLRRLNPTLPIIAASGLSGDDRFTKLSVQHFLPKPYRAEALLKILREILAAKL